MSIKTALPLSIIFLESSRVTSIWIPAGNLTPFTSVVSFIWTLTHSNVTSWFLVFLISNILSIIVAITLIIGFVIYLIKQKKSYKNFNYLYFFLGKAKCKSIK